MTSKSSDIERRFIQLQTTVFTLVMVVVCGIGLSLMFQLRVSPSAVGDKVDALATRVSESDRGLMLAAAIQSSRDAFVVLDENGLIAEWSDGAAELFGRSREQAIGYGTAFLMPLESDHSTHRNAFSNAMKSSDRGLIVRTIQCTVRTKSGDRPVELRVWAMPASGAIARFVVSKP